jgi:high-affinity iron transporter
MPANKAGTSTWILRTHEITEDMVRDTLSGNDDYGSGTGLASVTADVSATQEILHLLAPLINPRSPHLVPKAKAQLARLMSLAHSADNNGAWTGVADLSRAARERVDAAADAADETLAPVPDLLRITGI